MFSTVFPIKGSWRGRSFSFVRDLEDRCGLYLWPTIAKENVGSFVLIRWGFDRLPAIFKHLSANLVAEPSISCPIAGNSILVDPIPRKNQPFPLGIKENLPPLLSSPRKFYLDAY